MFLFAERCRLDIFCREFVVFQRAMQKTSATAGMAMGRHLASFLPPLSGGKKEDLIQCMYSALSGGKKEDLIQCMYSAPTWLC